MPPGIIETSFIACEGKVNNSGERKVTVICSPRQDGYFYHSLADFLSPSPLGALVGESRV